MSSAPARSPVSEVQNSVQAWAEALTEILNNGTSFEVSRQKPAEAQAPIDGDMWIAATSSAEAACQMLFRIDPRTTAGLAPSPAGDSQDSAHAPSTDKQAVLLELFRKGSVLVSKYAPTQKLDLQAELIPAPAELPEATYWLRADRETPFVVEVRLSPALLARFQRPEADSVPDSNRAGAGVDKLGILMDVELVATLRFGKRSMLLKDILDLCAGSVVELDQQVQEPVELLLDGKLIARGDVVIVDGNYGLRVTELLQTPAK
jgi:flagellar motor switch protein FliN